MSHTCGCSSASALDAGNATTTGTIRADQRVGEVTRNHPAAVAVMTELGVNHCCGADLTLAEAAAAAGVALERLLEALNERAGVA